MDLLEQIKIHEGFRPTVYKCTNHVDTIGYGFAIKDLYLDEDIAELILMRKIKKLLEQIIATFSWFKDSPEDVKFVVTNMCYQIGVNGFSKFKKTIYLLETEQYEDASEEMLNSKWARSDSPGRAKELSEILAKVKSRQ